MIKDIQNLMTEKVIRNDSCPSFDELAQDIDNAGSISRAARNKVKAFLMQAGIHTARDINYEIRMMFDVYLREAGLAKRLEYIKALDRIKLHSIQQDQNLTEKAQLKYKNQLVYLGYHPDYSTAMEFYYVRDKEELVFDFSLNAPERLKRQVFKMLVHSLERETNRKNRRELYIVPLKKLYLFCVERRIPDIELMQNKEIESFRRSMDGQVGTKAGIYLQIVNNTRKYLFMSSREIHWHANVWYLDRLRMRESQKNPANHVECLRFLQIYDSNNLDAFKKYMRFLICTRHNRMLTVRARYYRIHHFLLYCEDYQIKASDISLDQLRCYLLLLSEQEKTPGTLNPTIDTLYAFLQHTKNGIGKRMVIEMSYYKKLNREEWHSRAIDFEAQKEFMRAVVKFPEELRLMCQNLFLTGIRVNELCTIKGGAYVYDGNTAWLTVMQYKVSSENTIPIPLELYQQMKGYIDRNQIRADEYVFKNREGEAYDASTFRKQVQLLCEKMGLKYVFRPHKLRHARATHLHNLGIPEDQISCLLGHGKKDTTGRYISISTDQIDKANRQYYQEVYGESNGLADITDQKAKDAKDVHC